MIRRSLVIPLVFVLAACGQSDDGPTVVGVETSGVDAPPDTVTASGAPDPGAPDPREPDPGATATAAPDPSLVTVDVPSAVASTEITDPIAAMTPLEDNDLAVVMNDFDMVIPDVPMVVPAGGYLVQGEVRVNADYRYDMLSFLFTDDGTGDSTVDTLIAAAQPLGDFEPPEVTTDELIGVTTYKANLYATDPKGVQFGFRSETSSDFAGAQRITVTRVVRPDDPSLLMRPSFATDMTAEANAAASANGLTEPSEWTVTEGTTFDPLRPSSFYRQRWTTTVDDFRALGASICSAVGLEVDDKGEADTRDAQCQSLETGRTWNFIDPQFGDGTVLVQYDLYPLGY